MPFLPPNQQRQSTEGLNNHPQCDSNQSPLTPTPQSDVLRTLQPVAFLHVVLVTRVMHILLLVPHNRLTAFGPGQPG